MELPILDSQKQTTLGPPESYFLRDKCTQTHSVRLKSQQRKLEALIVRMKVWHENESVDRARLNEVVVIPILAI